MQIIKFLGLWLGCSVAFAAGTLASLYLLFVHPVPLLCAMGGLAIASMVWGGLNPPAEDEGW